MSHSLYYWLCYWAVSEICVFPEFFALQLEGQNLGSKRGRLKSAKYYPYKEQEEEYHSFTWSLFLGLPKS